MLASSCILFWLVTSVISGTFVIRRHKVVKIEQKDDILKMAEHLCEKSTQFAPCACRSVRSVQTYRETNGQTTTLQYPGNLLFIGHWLSPTPSLPHFYKKIQVKKQSYLIQLVLGKPK